MVKYICHTKMNILSRSVYFYLGKNTGSIFAFLLLYFCVATKTSLVFFVRGSFCELRIFIYKNCIYSVPYLNKQVSLYRLATIQQSALIEHNILFVSLCNSIGFCEFDGGSE